MALLVAYSRAQILGYDAKIKYLFRVLPYVDIGNGKTSAKRAEKARLAMFGEKAVSSPAATKKPAGVVLADEKMVKLNTQAKRKTIRASSK
jgi:hypothetical protein